MITLISFPDLSETQIQKNVISGEGIIMSGLAEWWAGVSHTFYKGFIRDSRYMLLVNGIKNTIRISKESFDKWLDPDMSSMRSEESHTNAPLEE